MDSASTSSATSAAVRVLGSRPVFAATRALNGRHLRVLAYHGIDDPAAFERQLRWLTQRFTPVSGSEVAEAAHGGQALAPRSMWITFDDGRSDTVAAGADVLARFGIVATMYVCPGLVAENRPFWWDEVACALAAGPVEFGGHTYTDRRLVTALKQVPDSQRRSAIAAMKQPLVETGRWNPPRHVADARALQRWLSADHELGNHTWDHPCLDQCSEEEVVGQITQAHGWLERFLGRTPTAFAYPNGDFTPVADETLRHLGYRTATLFDHRLTPSSDDPLRLSRLRIGTGDSIRRLSAVTSGAHSAVFHRGRR